MGSNQNIIDVVLRMDISDGQAKSQQFAADTERMNQRIAQARNAYETAQKAGATPEAKNALQAAVTAAYDERAAATANFKLQEQLHNDEFRATHTALEVQLRDRAKYYANLRSEHAGNAAMLTDIDKTWAAEHTRVVEAMEAEQLHIEAQAARQEDAIRRQSLMAAEAEAAEQTKIYQRSLAGMAEAGVGKPMLAEAGGEGLSMRHKRENLKFALAMAAGQQGGEGMGILSTGLLVGGPAGAAMTGLAVLGTAYETAKKEAEQLVETQQKHSRAIQESIDWMAKLSEGYSHNTRSGSAYGDRAREQSQKALELQQQMDKEDAEKGWFGKTMTGAGAILFHGGDITQTGYYKNREENIAQTEEAQRNAARARQASGQEQLYDQQSREAGAKAAVQAAALGSMGDGPEKRRQELQIRQAEERRKFRDETKEAERQFAREQQEVDAHGNAQQDAELTARKIAYGQSRSKEFGSMTQRQGLDTAAEEFKDEQELADQKLALKDADIAATQSGFGKEKALLDAKHEHEKAVLTASHADLTRMGLLEKQQADESATLQNNIAQAWSQKAHEQAEAFDVVTHKITAAEAAARDLDHQLHLQYGATKTEQEIQGLVDAFKKLSQAQIMQPIIEQTQRLGTEFSHITRQIGDIAYYKQQILEAHPGEKLDDAEVTRQAQAKYKNDLAAEAMGTRAKYRPMDEYNREKQRVDAETRMGVLTPDEGRAQLESKIRELGGAKAGGEFTGAEEHWKSVQSSLMAEDDVPKQQLEQLQALNKEFESLRTNGIVLKR